MSPCYQYFISENAAAIPLRDIQWKLNLASIISNYWMRLSRIWRILQIIGSVIHRGRRPRWITVSEICRILHILATEAEFNNGFIILFIQTISPFLKEFRHFALCFCKKSRPQVFSVNGLIIDSGVNFWRHMDDIGSIICSWLHFWHHWFNITKILFQIWSTAAGYGELCV